MVQRDVIFVSANQQVFRAVVRLVAIDVVDHLITRVTRTKVLQSSTECLLGNKDVLILALPSGELNHDVAMRAKRLVAHCGIRACLARKPHAVPIDELQWHALDPAFCGGICRGDACFLTASALAKTDRWFVDVHGVVKVGGPDCAPPCQLRLWVSR